MSIGTQNKIVPVWRNKTSIKILQSKKIILKLHVLGDAKKRCHFAILDQKFIEIHKSIPSNIFVHCVENKIMLTKID